MSIFILRGGGEARGAKMHLFNVLTLKYCSFCIIYHVVPSRKFNKMWEIIQAVPSSFKVTKTPVISKFIIYWWNSSLYHFYLSLLMDRNFKHNKNRWGIAIIHNKEYTFTVFHFFHFGSSEALYTLEVQRTRSMHMLYANHMMSWQ